MPPPLGERTLIQGPTRTRDPVRKDHAMADQPTVAVLGTGTMGAPMARNLASAGMPVRVWNRSKDKAEPLAEAGVHVADSPAEAVEGADVVLTMLFDAEAVVETMESAAGALRPGAVWVQASTVGLTGEQRMKTLADELGVTYVDAPVLGTRQPAEKGALVVLAAGPAEARDRLAPVFDAVGQRTMWVGEAGAATRLKLVVNAFVLTVLEGVAQSLSTARALGLDPSLFLEAVEGGAVDAPYVQLKGANMISGRFDTAFSLSGAHKDAGLIAEAMATHGVDTAVVEAIRAHQARAIEAGNGDADMAATYLER
jgi:3-hydroxyisobutyrate dehydrogenase